MMMLVLTVEGKETERRKVGMIIMMSVSMRIRVREKGGDGCERMLWTKSMTKLRRRGNRQRFVDEGRRRSLIRKESRRRGKKEESKVADKESRRRS